MKLLTVIFILSLTNTSFAAELVSNFLPQLHIANATISAKEVNFDDGSGLKTKEFRITVNAVYQNYCTYQHSGAVAVTSQASYGEKVLDILVVSSPMLEYYECDNVFQPIYKTYELPVLASMNAEFLRINERYYEFKLEK